GGCRGPHPRPAALALLPPRRPPLPLRRTGGEPGEAEETGMKQTFGFDPVFPLLQVAAFGLLAIALALWLYRRELRGRVGELASWRVRDGTAAPLTHQLANSPALRLAVLAALRALAVAAVAAALLNPVLTREQQESGRPPLLVLL